MLDLSKEKLGDWPCLLLADAPPETPQPRAVVSGASGEVDVYADDAVLERPTAADRFFSWGEAPRKEGGPRSLARPPGAADADAAAPAATLEPSAPSALSIS